nr:hypothetical protein [Agrobacterium burrii]
MTPPQVPKDEPGWTAKIDTHQVHITEHKGASFRAERGQSWKPDDKPRRKPGSLNLSRSKSAKRKKSSLVASTLKALIVKAPRNVLSASNNGIDIEA